jgi:hypothetical protein
LTGWQGAPETCGNIAAVSGIEQCYDKIWKPRRLVAGFQITITGDDILTVVSAKITPPGESKWQN